MDRTIRERGIEDVGRMDRKIGRIDRKIGDRKIGRIEGEVGRIDRKTEDRKIGRVGGDGRGRWKNRQKEFRQKNWQTGENN